MYSYESTISHTGESMDTAIQIIGWIGMIFFVGAYFLMSQGYIVNKSAIYKLMNLVGSISMAINVGYNHAWPALALQFTWGIITLLSFRRS